MQLPFPDGAFDAVVCQFGVMFFPDKARAFAEARRVLKPGGVFVFNVWDRLMGTNHVCYGERFAEIAGDKPMPQQQPA